jgi:DNA-binding transcriptional ArsR family regulator
VKPPPRGLIEHDGRLDTLCCLDDDGPLTATAISARVGIPIAAVTYYLVSLDSRDVVRRTGEGEDGEPLYESRLDEQPEWVRRAVEAHRRGKG